VDNDEFATTAELASLGKAAPWLEGDVVVSFGDILFRRYILSNLLQEPGDIVIVVDSGWRGRTPVGQVDYVQTSRPFTLKYSEDIVTLRAMSADLPSDRIDGEWIGLVKCTARGAKLVRGALAALEARADFARLRLDDLFRHLLGQGIEVQVLFITGHWLDVDNLDDLAQAQTF
jgi:phosphoenolpyruvate phosphomutase